MSIDPPARTLRGLAGALRHNTRRVTRVASRFNRAGLYLWDLLVWSRIEAARSGLVSLELPVGLLEKKKVRLGPPLLRMRAPQGRLGHFNDGFAAVNALLFANLQRPDVLSAYRYALPGPAFRGVYLWDSAFIAQIWRSWDREVAVDVVKAVVALRDGDRLQHVVADFVQSAFTQPPLIAWVVADLVADGGGEEVAKEFYAPLSAYHAWLRAHRRLPNGLYAWRHPYESGIDNSPRFSSRDEGTFRETRGVAAPDFSTYVILHAEALAQLARVLGRDDEAEVYEAEAAEIRAVMNAFLWHAEDGCYYDRRVSDGAWTRVRTIASLLPLWAGVPDVDRAGRLRELAVSPEHFGTLMPLPSVALSEACFEKDMWRGPVWINTAYGVILGLERYGFRAEAAELAWRLCDGVYRVFGHERQIYEFYDPREFHTKALTRKRGNWWKRLTLGGGPQREFVGWSGLVNALVISVLFGFRREAGRRWLRPHFPAEAVGAVFRLVLPAEELALEVALETGDHVQGFVQGPGGLRTFSAVVGERIDLDALLEKAADPAQLSR